MGAKYLTANLPADDIIVVCDECLQPCSLQKFGYTYISRCTCGLSELEINEWEFPLGAKRKVFVSTVFVSTIFKPSNRKRGSYNDGRFEKLQILVEIDTGVLIESDDDMKSLMWATDYGRNSYEALEQRSIQLMELYNKFKHVADKKG